jgi:outer membrane protein TolC
MSTSMTSLAARRVPAAYRSLVPGARRTAMRLAATVCMLAATQSIQAQTVPGTMSAPASANALDLDGAIALALSRGPSARSASFQREAARWRDRSFNARLLPQLSLAGDLPVYSRAIIPVIQPDGSTKFVAQQQRQSSLAMTVAQRLPFTGGDLFMSTGVSNLNILGQQETKLWRSTPFQVGIRQQIFRPNTLAWESREQDLRADVAEREYLEAREDIAQRTSNLFFELFAARATLANAELNALANDTLIVLNKGRFEVGRIGENDLLQSELSVLRARAALDGARLAADRAAASLRIQLGLPPGAPLELRVTNTVPRVTIDTVAVVSRALENASQSRGRELQDVQQRRRVNEAKRNTGFAATVNASVGYNQTALTFNEAYRSPLQSQQFSVGVEMPVLQWGARSAQIEAARADQERFQTDAKTARENQVQEALYAALGLAQAERQLEISAKADSVGAKRFEVARNRYSIGRIDFSNLAIAQTEKDQALQGYLQALRGYWDAYYRLRRLTLWDFVRDQPLR